MRSRKTNVSCAYGWDCTEKVCFPPFCPVKTNDDGRQDLLDEICADYRVAVKTCDSVSAETALKALQREMLDYEGMEWDIPDLEKALRPVVSGSNWKRRGHLKKVAWESFMNSLMKIMTDSLRESVSP